MADAYEVNVAPHNFNGHLGSLISAHMCAVAPNFKVMEIDIDDVTWKDDIVTHPPVIENGELLLPTGPGWGADVNEEFVRARPPKGWEAAVRNAGTAQTARLSRGIVPRLYPGGLSPGLQKVGLRRLRLHGG